MYLQGLIAGLVTKPHCLKRVNKNTYYVTIIRHNIGFHIFPQYTSNTKAYSTVWKSQMYCLKSHLLCQHTDTSLTIIIVTQQRRAALNYKLNEVGPCILNVCSQSNCSIKQSKQLAMKNSWNKSILVYLFICIFPSHCIYWLQILLILSKLLFYWNSLFLQYPSISLNSV